MNLFKLTGSSNSKLCLIVLLWVITTCTRAETHTLEGKYYLYGVMEMAAGLQLEKDGTLRRESNMEVPVALRKGSGMSRTTF